MNFRHTKDTECGSERECDPEKEWFAWFASFLKITLGRNTYSVSFPNTSKPFCTDRLQSTRCDSSDVTVPILKLFLIVIDSKLGISIDYTTIDSRLMDKSYMFDIDKLGIDFLKLTYDLLLTEARNGSLILTPTKLSRYLLIVWENHFWLSSDCLMLNSGRVS